MNMKKTILKTFSKLTFADDRFCYDIEESEKDKFTGEKKFSTPILDSIRFIKRISQEGAISYDLYLNTYNNTSAGLSAKGAHVLFKDGSKFSKPDKKIFYRAITYKCSYNYYKDYNNSAYVTITEEELKIFSEKLITDIRLYIFDSEIDKKSAIKIREYAKCLLNM